MSYRPEVLLPVLTKSLEQVKVPRGRIAILEFFRDVVAQVSSREQLHPGHLRTWLHRLSPLLEDKSLELRHLATDVVEGLWAAEWPRETLTTVAYQSNSLDVVPLRKLVLALNGAAQAASIAVAGSSASIAPAAAVPMPAHRVSASNAAVPAPMELDGDEQAAVPQVSGVEASAAAPASISGINTREAFPSESVAAAHGGRPASAAAGPSVSMSQQLAMPSHQQYNAANYMSPARHSISGLPSSYGVGSAGKAGNQRWAEYLDIPT